MNQTQALKLVNKIHSLALKAQSILAESDKGNTVSEAITLGLFKWTAKSQDKASVLVNTTNQILEVDKVTGMQLYNLLYICQNEILIQTILDANGESLPEPNLGLVRDLGAF